MIAVRAASLLRVKVKITVKFPVCSMPKTHAYGVFDCDFGFDFKSGAALRAAPLVRVKTKSTVNVRVFGDSMRGM